MLLPFMHGCYGFGVQCAFDTPLQCNQALQFGIAKHERSPCLSMEVLSMSDVAGSIEVLHNQ